MVIQDRKEEISQLNLILKSIIKQESSVGDLLFQLMNVSIAQGGLSVLASKTGLGRESLYKTLSPQGNPHLITFLEIIRGLGLNIKFEPTKDVIKKNIKENSSLLTETHEKLLGELHPIKNSKKAFFEYKYSKLQSHKRFWWQCFKGPDHEWSSPIVKRINGAGCPVCAGKKIVASNSLASTHPHVIQEWHSLNNKDLTPHDVSARSNKKAWWQCNKNADHQWQSTILHRALGIGCPFCKADTYRK